MSDESISIVNNEQYLCVPDEKKNSRKCLYFLFCHLRKFWRGQRKKAKITANVAFSLIELI